MTVHKLKLLSLAVATALGVASLANPVYAQDQQGDEDELLIEEIIVTGSRIVRKELISENPVQVLTNADIDATGLNNLGDVLMNITASDGTGLRPVTTATNGSDGSQQISLRGLGADRTLILVDGRRWVTDIDQTVDLNTIPLAMVERIEILKDGASAIYGSDAIAGVINVITKKDFQGISAYAYYGSTSDGDGTQKNLALTIGAGDDSKNVVMGMSYTSQEEIFAGDRGVSNTPYFGCQDPNIDSQPLCGSSYPEYGRYFDNGQTLIPGRPGTSVDDFTDWSNSARYNYAPINYLQQPIERYSFFASGRMELTENMEVYGKFVYVKRKSDQQLAEVPLTVGVSGPQWNWRPGANVTGDNYFNPFGYDIGQWGLRMRAVGPRAPSYDYDTLGVNLGLKGSFEAANREWNWDVGGQYNDGQYDSTGTGYINLFNLANATGPSFRDDGGNLRCGTAEETIRGCTPFNIFGGPDLGLGAGVITQDEYDAMIDYVSYTQVSSSGNSTMDWYADITSDLFELPGGMAAFAAGVEWRQDSAFNAPDALVAGGGSSDNFSEPTNGKTTSKEAYLEVLMPILADVKGAQQLDLDIAVRYVDFDGKGTVGNDELSTDIDSDTMWKVGVAYRPVEQLLLRANWGQTFRAPSVVDLYGGGGESFPSTADPCNTVGFPQLDADQQARCLRDNVPPGGAPQPTSQLRTLVGGNPFLGSEQGDNITAGFVWTPDFAEGLEILMDYWKIKLDDAQSRFGSAYILNQCYREGNNGFCSFVERDAVGQIDVVRTAAFNAAERKVAGIDFGVRYLWDTDNAGAFQFTWNTTWTDYDKTKVGDDGEFDDAVGIYQGATAWEWRSNFVTQWAYKDFVTTWTMRYMSKLEEDCWLHYYGIGDIDPDSPTFDPIMCSDPTKTNIFDDTGVNYLAATLYNDLQVAWSAPWGAVITAGGRNIFGHAPPKTQNSFAHSFDGAYDLPGGPYWYVSYRHDF